MRFNFEAYEKLYPREEGTKTEENETSVEDFDEGKENVDAPTE